MGDTASGAGVLSHDEVTAAGIATESIATVPSWARDEVGSPFVFDPASGALVLRPEYRGKAAKAIRCEQRRLALALYVRQFGPKGGYLRFQIAPFVFLCRRFVLQPIRYALGVAKQGGGNLIFGNVRHQALRCGLITGESNPQVAVVSNYRSPNPTPSDPSVTSGERFVSDIGSVATAHHPDR